MAPTAAPSDSYPLPFFFLFFLLFLLLGPAWGNEGGAAGSCRCQLVRTYPDFLDKLVFCDTCRYFTRFNFPKRKLCGLIEDPWVIQLKKSHCLKGRPEAGRADASRRDHVPAPTSPRTISAATSPIFPRTAPTVTSPTFPRTAPTATSPSSAGVSPDESQEILWVTESHQEVTGEPTITQSTPEPSTEAAAGEANKAPLEEEEAAPLSATDAKIPSITVLCVLVVGFVLLIYCWRRRQRSHNQGDQRPQIPLGDEEEGTVCLPGENT